MILLGIKKENISGSGSNSYGYSSFSSTSTNVEVIKEGNEEELIFFVEKIKEKVKKIKETYDRLDNGDITHEECDEEIKKLCAGNEVVPHYFDKLLMLEGYILK